MIPFQAAEGDPDAPDAIRSMVHWTRRYVCGVTRAQGVVGNRRDESGALVTDEQFRAKDRRAHVCPFVDESIERGLFWIEQFEASDEAGVEGILRSQIPEFLNADPAFHPSEASPATDPTRLKTFLSIFPLVLHDRGSMALFDRIHATLKPEFMRVGLMLGQFYFGCPQPGIYSEAFRPLGSPWPAFAVRYMVRHDHLFAGDDHLATYERFFPRG